MSVFPAIGLNGFVGSSPDYGKYRVIANTWGIYVSSDYGNTFTEKFSNYLNLTTVAVSDTCQYIIVRASSYGILFSSDYGESWTRTNTESSWVDVAISSTGQYIAKLRDGVIYISQDYGATWPYSYTTASPYKANAICISANGQYFFATAYSRTCYRSSNYGQTWTAPSSFPVNYNYAGNCSISETGQYILVAYDSNVANLCLSSNYGASWTLANTSYSTNGRTFMNKTGQYQAHCYSTSIYVSQDYGVNWSITLTVSGVTWKHCFVSETGQYMIAVATDGTTYKSTNYGTSFTKMVVSQTIYTFAITPKFE